MAKKKKIRECKKGRDSIVNLPNWQKEEKNNT